MAGRVKPGKRQRVVAGEPVQAWRKFAEEYATDGDSYRSYVAAYPHAARWQRASVTLQAWRLRQRPEVAQYILELRKPIVQGVQFNYEWTLREVARQYYYANEQNDTKNALSALRHMSRLLGLEAPDPQRMMLEVLSPDEYAELKQRFLREIGASLSAPGAGEGARPGQDFDAEFHRLVERVPDGAPPPVDDEAAR